MTFHDFAASHGLLIDRVIEGRWVRVKTEDKSTKRNGAYKFLGDIAFIQNHRTMDRVAVWRPEGKSEMVDRKEIRRLMAKNAEAEVKRQSLTKAIATEMLKRAVVSKHAYLAKKGFPEECGFVLQDELLVPMREFSKYREQLNSLQRIKPDGSKLFLSGGKAKGSVFFIGPSAARERWLVEGYATGLTVRLALRELHREAQVIVCFSAHNLAHVGKLVKRPAFVMADNDKGNVGMRAAEETGLPWTMPIDVDEDANDVHQRDGLRAVVRLIREIDGRRMALG